MSGFDPDSNREVAPPDLDHQLRAELERGERLLWSGQPIASRLFLKAFALYLFAIPWTAFALFWEVMALSPWLAMQSAENPDNAQQILSIVFPLFGLPFIAIGFWMLAKPFVLLRKAGRIVYAITDRRAIIAVLGRGGASEIESYSYSQMGQGLQRNESADGSGSLYFAIGRSVGSDGKTRLRRRGFEAVAKVQEVESKLRRAIEAFEAAEEG